MHGLRRENTRQFHHYHLECKAVFFYIYLFIFYAALEYICLTDVIFSRELRSQHFNMNISFNKETKVSLSITLTGGNPLPSYVLTECELTVCGHCGAQTAHCCRLLLTLTAYPHSDVQPISSIPKYIIHTLHKVI